MALGYQGRSIDHRIDTGRLHPVWRGVFAVGRPELSAHGRWMAAVLSCGPGAALSHEDAGALWEIRARRRGAIEISVPASSYPRRKGIVVYRRSGLEAGDLTVHYGIPVTTPACTLVDLATRLKRRQLEAAVNETDKLGLIDPEGLRRFLDESAGRSGTAVLRRLLDRPTFTLTDSELERRFLPLARRAGLAKPQTQRRVNGFRVDFYWPNLGLVVETDGLRYHRTPGQQARDRLRDQAHTASGLTPLRFTFEQIVFERERVATTLAQVARRLERRP